MNTQEDLDMSTKKTLETAYFHVSDGGISLSVVEKTDVRKDCVIYPKDWFTRDKTLGSNEGEVRTFPREDRYNRSWRFRVAMSCYGASTRFDFPITPLMVKWTIGALTRVLVRMETPTGRPADDRNWGLDGNRHALVQDFDGQKATGGKKYFPEKTEAEMEAERAWQSQGPQMEDPLTENS